MKKIALLVTATLFITGCGGGGGGGNVGATTVSTLAFPLQAAYLSRISGGSGDSYSVSGDCSGRAGISNTVPGAPVILASGKPVPQLFVGKPAWPSREFVSITCHNSYSSASSYKFYDSNYSLLGYYIPASVNENAEYAQVTSSTPIPRTVHVGDSLTTTTLSISTDITKSYGFDISTKLGDTSTGYATMSYVIEPDTATTAIVNVITKKYHNAQPAPELFATQQSRYRITSDGTLNSISTDIVWHTLAQHMTFNRN